MEVDLCGHATLATAGHLAYELLSAAPTRVLADLPIDLPRSLRNDEAAVEAFRAELLSRAGPAFRLLG